jgi:tryptophan dimethylallyltransferase
MPASTVSEVKFDLDEVVYNTLSDVFSFTNEDEKLWWHSTGPMFAKMLRMANYDIHSQYKHLAIYKKRVVPFLGVYPERNNNDRWLSILTRFGTPFELSLNCSDSPVVRYTYEPINSSTGAVEDLFNTHSIWESLQQLVAIQPDVNLEWFNHFKQELTLSSAESKFLAENGPIKTGIKTQNKLALDLKGDHFVLKTYIYPELKAIASGKSTDELIFASVRKISLQYDSILPALSVLEDYAKSRSGLNSTTSVRLLSCDLVKPTKSRIKIYILERMVSLPAMKDLWTLGGRLTDPSTVAGFELIEELWDMLHIPVGLQTYPASYLPIGSTPNEQLPTMANYTLHHNEPMPEPQVYFNTFGMNDMAVADALTTFFERHGWTEMAHRYKESLRSY